MLKVNKRWAAAVASETLESYRVAQECFDRARKLEQAKPVPLLRRLREFFIPGEFFKTVMSSLLLDYESITKVQMANPDIMTVEHAHLLRRYYFKTSELASLRETVALCENIDGEHINVTERQFLDLVDISVSIGITPPAALLP